MTDTEREDRIRQCGEQLQAAYAAGDRQQAQECLREQQTLIRGRSSEQVARMEQERGLAA